MGGFLRPVVKREVTTRLLQVVLEFGPEVAGIAGEELRPSPSRAVYILKTALFTERALHSQTTRNGVRNTRINSRGRTCGTSPKSCISPGLS